MALALVFPLKIAIRALKLITALQGQVWLRSSAQLRTTPPMLRIQSLRGVLMELATMEQIRKTTFSNATSTRTIHYFRQDIASDSTLHKPKRWQELLHPQLPNLVAADFSLLPTKRRLVVSKEGED